MSSSMDNIKIEGLCRTCMNEDLNLLSIYDYPSKDEYRHSPARIVDLLAIAIPQLTATQLTDALPKGICNECVNKLLACQEFQEMCLQSEKCMLQMLQPAAGVEYKVLDLPENNVEVCMREEDPLQSSDLPTNNGEQGPNEKESNQTLKTEENTPTNLEEEDTGISSSSTDLNLHETQEMPEAEVKEKALSPRQFNCKICGKEFNRLFSLKRHEKVDHDRLPKYKDYDCRACDMKFSSTSSVRRHEKAMHNLVLPPDGAKIADNRPRRHKCEYCEKAYIDRPSLTAHIRTHTGEAPFLCPECGKAFTSAGNMKQHLKRHSKEKVFECPDCPMKFTLSSYLAKHRITHKKEKRFVCELCGKGFIRHDMLTSHTRRHSGERPFKCDHCDKRFAFSGPLRQHLRTHTGEKPYKCKYCECPFAQSGDLIKHLRLHLGDNVYECELCPQSFRFYTEMREHFALHKTDDDETREANLKAKTQKEVQIKELKRSKYKVLSK